MEKTIVEVKPLKKLLEVISNHNIIKCTTAMLHLLLTACLFNTTK